MAAAILYRVHFHGNRHINAYHLYVHRVHHHHRRRHHLYHLYTACPVCVSSGPRWGLSSSNWRTAAITDSRTSGRSVAGSSRTEWASKIPDPSSSIMSLADSARRAMWKLSSKIEVLPTVLIVVYAPAAEELKSCFESWSHGNGTPPLAAPYIGFSITT